MKLVAFFTWAAQSTFTSGDPFRLVSCGSYGNVEVYYQLNEGMSAV